MSERHGWLFEPTFNRSVKVRAADIRVTSDAGLLLFREADRRSKVTSSPSNWGCTRPPPGGGPIG